MVGVLGVTTALYGRCICTYMYMYISLCVGVNAITADIYPNCTSCTLNGFATFSCTASPYVAGITFVVAGVDPTMWASRGISQSAPAYSGNATTTNLTVLGTIANNGLLVTCRVFVGTTYQDIVPPAVLTVEGW